MGNLISAEELSKRFNVHIETVRLWARQGRISSIRPTARTIRFDLKEVEKELLRPILRRKQSSK